MHRSITQLVAASLLAALSATPALGAVLPPRNPHLADSSYPLGHGNAAQQDSVAQAGPHGTSRALSAAEIDYVSTGPGLFGVYTSGPYSDGRRVFWGNGLDRILKIDHDSFAVLASHELPGEHYTEAQAEESIARFERSNSGPLAILAAFREMLKFRNLAGIYTLLDRDDVYYIGDAEGNIVAFGDADPADPASAIVKRREVRLPPEISGPLVGMNMTFDGWLVAATEHGFVVAIRRDFGALRSVRMLHSEDAAQKSGGRGRGWIRNGLATDEDGGIYVASQEHMHKLLWNGERLSTDARDGAWTAGYRNGGGNGTGATPSLMGFGDEDRFVVITDGDALMNVTLFWRDEIPEGWTPPPGAPDRRIAGQLPAHMGDPGLTEIQSEQSVVVAGYGALVVNNAPRNVPWYVPVAARMTVVGPLGSNPDHQPFGVQKFEWNPRERRLEHAWVNREVSSPNCLPIASYASNRIYLIGARENRFTLEALDWSTGASAFHWQIGGQRYNSLFSGTLIDEAGRVHYGGPWGRVRIDPHSGLAQGQTAAIPPMP
jgi:hypothetical protein